MKEKVAEEVQKVGRGCNGCITAGSWRTGFSAPTPQTLHDNVIPFNPSEPRKPWDVSGAAPRRCSLNPRSAQPVHLLSLSFCFSPFLSPLRLIIVLLLTLFFTSSRTFAPLLCVQLTPGFFQSKPNACVCACMYVCISVGKRSEYTACARRETNSPVNGRFIPRLLLSVIFSVVR